MGFRMRGVTRIVVRSSDMINAIKFKPTRTSSMVKEEEKEEHLREFGTALLVDFDPGREWGWLVSLDYVTHSCNILLFATFMTLKASIFCLRAINYLVNLVLMISHF